MKTFYIEVNGQQSEPLTLEELKGKNITRDTLVWTEGMSSWEKAGSVSELDEIFKTTPPPLVKSALPPPITQSAPANGNNSFIANNRSKILLVSMSIVLILILFYSFGNKGLSDTEIRSVENSEIILQQQQQLEEQNAKIKKQEAIERARAEEKRQLRITELTTQIIQAEEQVEVAKKKINDATAFQLLRSSDERNAQINTANENLKYWEDLLVELTNDLQKISQ